MNERVVARFQSVHNEIVTLSNLKDFNLKDKYYEPAYRAHVYYFRARLNSKWSTLELEALRPLFQTIYDCLILKHTTDLCLSVRDILQMKSSLVLMSEDFPDLADSFLYSPLMERLKKIIEARSVRSPPFKSVFDFWLALRDKNLLLTQNNAHVWWNIVEAVEFIEEVPVKEAIRKYRLQTEKRNKKEFHYACAELYKAQEQLTEARLATDVSTEAHQKLRNAEAEFKVVLKRVQQAQKYLDFALDFGKPELDDFMNKRNIDRKETSCLRSLVQFFGKLFTYQS